VVSIFLDESGDLGFNPKKRSSKYFIVTVLSVKDKKPIEKIIKRVHANLRKKNKKLSGGILHAYKEKSVTRKRILKALNEKEISIMTIYLNKDKVYTKLREEKHVLYNYVVNILLDRIMTKKLIEFSGPVNLYAAKRETNKFLNENFKDYLKQKVSSGHKLKIEVEIKTPSEEKSLQATDFISWGIFRKYELGDDSYYNIIKSKIVEENPLFS